ncbi:hypothetical protein C1646_706464 [Rhizophagus diaphanus]|nr:hypothetical protein C1646_706464 [Rhizophagus diaphanus] [Rhizophagus sp. MUCL 43196]
MSRNKEYLETVEETKNTSNEFNGYKIKYQRYTRNQDNFVTSPVNTVKTVKAVKGFSPISDSSSTVEGITYKIPNVPTEEQNMSLSSNNGNGNQNYSLNNPDYVMAFPSNSTSRIDPSLLNYHNNMTMHYVQPYTSSLPVGNNPVSNCQALYWNEEAVQTQTACHIPSYYGTISGSTPALGYENLTQQIFGENHVSNAPLVTRDYMILAEAHPNKGKKKRGRKPESDYSHTFPSLSSPTSTDEICQGEIAHCSNCGVFDTPAWRRDLYGIALLCNACGL